MPFAAGAGHWSPTRRAPAKSTSRALGIAQNRSPWLLLRSPRAPRECSARHATNAVAVSTSVPRHASPRRCSSPPLESSTKPTSISPSPRSLTPQNPKPRPPARANAIAVPLPAYARTMDACLRPSCAAAAPAELATATAITGHGSAVQCWPPSAPAPPALQSHTPHAMAAAPAELAVELPCPTLLYPH
ncbi:uncharacterized protein LOC120669494 [Panicum virgatum]|uniref:uncharacterized protein LOC120669494 n=1 Tax=Panicum virgatum TaxID=38727 RepID=UPI0019D6463A|nr:uncharacterized protein LOC120669494 [Panicum virgatum]